ncbi:NDP-hexose 2,3-dehydratase family protein [Streptomyces cyanogenus]|uniref:NDP-hexose 2,3-dehydratase n=1 Tax=Streptomyces cyanogenus TaxID=80860 RepID=A0ABX7TK05_STRCY|nr:NDP-hexose 2,3-dehydratase family protein [Streptomyces cyanogenus]QTD96696.1 NDP-hexose 2,3-dehydratase [Streptomyces cyanogenus]
MLTSLAARVALSAAATETGHAPLADFHQWWKEQRAADDSASRVIPFADLRMWSFRPDTGDLVHDTGRFFTVEGLRVRRPGWPVPHWSQPIIHQPEVGILGILAKEFDGVLHFLMQAKTEPGNIAGPQLSPTVQATRSNYTRVHRGNPVPYVEYFRNAARHRVLADVRQSEQGSWFYRKRNRNMVVEVTEDVELLDGFRWVPLGQLHRLLAEDDLVNMDSRTVLACLPFPFAGADGGSHRPADTAVLGWITEARTRHELLAERVPLREVTGWRHEPDRITHESGAFFDVMAVAFQGRGREIAAWTQPMVRPHGTGVSAFLVRRTGDGVQVLASTRVEAGSADVLELGPTAQGTPENYAALPDDARPPLLDAILGAPAERVLFDTVMSEEGGRFFHARTRYLIVEAGPDGGPEDTADLRWIPLEELTDLARHSFYVNVDARTLMVCLQSVYGPDRAV